MSFEAKYPGFCPGCLEAIRVGDLVDYTDNGRGVVHVECPDVPEEKPTKFRGTSLDDMGF